MRTGSIILVFIIILLFAGRANNGYCQDKIIPTIDVMPSHGNLLPESEIVIKLKDNTVHNFSYIWDNGAENTMPIYSNGVTITAPKEPGSHVLYIYPKDNSKSTEWVSYNYYIEEVTDKEPPILTVSPNGGSLSRSSEITVQANDPSRIHHIGYYWNSESKTTPVYSDTAKIKIPDGLIGTNILHIYAKDASPKYNNTGWCSYEYSVNTKKTSLIWSLILVGIIIFIKKIYDTVTLKCRKY